LLVGERIEILVNLGNDAVGSSINMMAYNANQAFGFPGGEPQTNGQFGSFLNNKNFNVLHINIGAATANPVTTLPTTLASNTYLSASQATITRNLNITGGTPGTNQPFVFDNTAFNMTTINKTVNLNDIEKWTVTNNNVFGHTFHIHDVQFKIVARNGNPAGVGDYESGWKDVMYVPRNENVSFVAKFDDFADSVYPYMYHCHFSNHEDAGMMGQFVVKGNDSSIVPPPVDSGQPFDFAINPNPVIDRLYLAMSAGAKVEYLWIYDALGRTIMMLPAPDVITGINLLLLPKGIYFVRVLDNTSGKYLTKKFVKG